MADEGYPDCYVQGCTRNGVAEVAWPEFVAPSQYSWVIMCSFHAAGGSDDPPP